MLDSLFGNNELKQSLLVALSGGRLSHSILFCGEEGAGVNFAARCLAADYLYPDNAFAAAAIMRGEGAECITITGEGASGDIKIDTVREMRREIYNTAISASGRCVLIKNAQRLNGASANAVLKVLEEPPDNVLFILTAPSEAAILPTIRSRCTVYTVCPTTKSECEAYLLNIAPSQSEAARLSSIFDGSIGTAKRILQNEREAELFKSAEELFSCFIAKNEIRFAAILIPYEKDKPAAARLFAYTRILLSSALQSAETSARAGKALNAIYNTQQQLARNAQAKLAFTVLAAMVCE